MSSPLRKEVPAVRDEETPKAATPGAKRKPWVLVILGLLVVGGGIFGWNTIHFYSHHATTDDAQVEGHIHPVLPRVSGYVSEVAVKENQAVRAGEVLVRIDPADLQAKVDQEAADLANAEAAVAMARAAVSGNRSNVAGSRSSIASLEANLVAARVRQEQAASDLARYQALLAKEEISQMQFDSARSANDAALAALNAARSQVEAARAASSAASAQLDASGEQIGAAEAKVAQRRAALEAARLQLSYATVSAPANGVVSKKNVEAGQFVQAGQPLLSIVEGEDTWVVANFKETQLSKMQVGQPVEVEVDAYPGVTFHGKVDSLAAATGAKFSLLPPDNATGNFTKVVQRIPVKIVITDPPNPKRPLRVGMNVSVVVDLG